MSNPVEITTDGQVAVVTIDSPPVNALSHAVRAGLMAALDRIEADNEVGAVVLRAEGHTFPAGADIAEFASAPQSPDLPEVCNRLEAFGKPVVASLHGTVLGGGLELALAAHWRVATSAALLGLPEVLLGVLPGAGGTVRLPRIVGAGTALEMMLSGTPVSAEAAATSGIVDAVVPGDPTPAALELAREMSAKGRGIRRTSARTGGLDDPAAYLAEVSARRASADPMVPSARCIVDCVEAALLLPVEQALARERDAFDSCLDTPESRALRHAFLAERRAGKIPERGRGQVREVTRAGVVGGGVAAQGLAMALLDAGLPVILCAYGQDACEAARESIETLYLDRIERGALSEDQGVARLSRFQPVTEAGPLAECDLVVEATTAGMAALRKMFAGVDVVVAPEALLATGQPDIDLTDLATSTTRPARVIGLHVPAPGASLFEVAVGSLTGPDAVLSAFALARQLGGFAVRTAAGRGAVSARVLAAWQKAMRLLVEDGVSPASIDVAMAEAGFPEAFRTAGDDTATAGSSRVTLDEIRCRGLSAMANEGARLFAEGTVLRPSDVDVVMMGGLGFPRWLGGPMRWADETGLLTVRNDLRAWSAEEPRFWTPVPLWDELIKNGLRFSDQGV